MAKQPAKTAEKLKDNETLNGSNTLPAKIEFGPDKSVQLGEIVVKAHQASGLSVDAWNALPAAERDELLNKTIEELRPIAEAATVDQTLDEALAAKATLLAAVDNLQGIQHPPLAETSHMIIGMVAEQVLIVSAPAGPRRRAGISFGPNPIELRGEDLGDEPEQTIEALRADPFLKLDYRFEQHPADED